MPPYCAVESITRSRSDTGHACRLEKVPAAPGKRDVVRPGALRGPADGRRVLPSCSPSPWTVFYLHALQLNSAAQFQRRSAISYRTASTGEHSDVELEVHHVPVRTNLRARKAAKTWQPTTTAPAASRCTPRWRETRRSGVFFNFAAVRGQRHQPGHSAPKA